MNCIWILLLLCCCGQNGCSGNERDVNDCGCDAARRVGQRRRNSGCGFGRNSQNSCDSCAGGPGPVIQPRRPLPPFSPDAGCGCERNDSDFCDRDICDRG